MIEKKATGVGVCDLFDFIERKIQRRSDTRGDGGDIGTFVAFTSVGHGGEPRSIGFEKNPVEPDLGKGLAEERGILESDDTVDSKPGIADSTDPADIRDIAGEAVEHHPRQSSFE